MTTLLLTQLMRLAMLQTTDAIRLGTKKKPPGDKQGTQNLQIPAPGEPIKPKVEPKVEESEDNGEKRVHAQEVKHDEKYPGN